MAGTNGGVAPGKGTRLKTRERRVVGTPAFAVLVFIVSLVVFHWPYLAEETHWTPTYRFITMFAGWALVIGLIYLFSLFLPSSGSEDKKPPASG